MAIKLLEHNNILFSEIVNKMEEGHRKIFYSEATGLGKSFIFMKLVEQYFMGRNVLYIAPKNAIWDNLTHYKEFKEIDSDRIVMTTFNYFNTIEHFEELLNEFSVVFVDECHHMLSNIQGYNVNEFCDEMVARGGYVFGMTATPFVKDKFVDDVYFPVSCYGLNSFEAIKQGLLPKINIAVSVPQNVPIPDDVRVKYSIDSTKTMLQYVLEDYKDIKHWLVYFSTIQDLEDSVDEIRNLFPDYIILKAYQGIRDTDKIIHEFEHSKEKVILLSVSMFLEGLHLRNVKGVLLYRNITSVSLYIQILGRLCNLKADAAPVLVDVTQSILKFKDSKRLHRGTGERFNSTYELKDIFNQEAVGYKTLELLEEILQPAYNEYRGIRWRTRRELACELGVKESTIHSWFSAHPNDTGTDYIDFVLDGPERIEDINGIASQIGVGRHAIRFWLRRHPDKTVEDYIEEHSVSEYRGVTWRTSADVSRHFNLGENTAYSWLKRHSDKTLEDFIDYMLDGVDTKFKNKQDVTSYRGIVYSSINDVAGYFKIHNSNIYRWLSCNPNTTVEDYIDHRLDTPPRKDRKSVCSGRVYRGVECYSLPTVARCFGISCQPLYKWLDENPDTTVEDFVDYKLDYPNTTYVVWRKRYNWCEENKPSICKNLTGYNLWKKMKDLYFQFNEEA